MRGNTERKICAKLFGQLGRRSLNKQLASPQVVQCSALSSEKKNRTEVGRSHGAAWTLSWAWTSAPQGGNGTPTLTSMQFNLGLCQMGRQGVPTPRQKPMWAMDAPPPCASPCRRHRCSSSYTTAGWRSSRPGDARGPGRNGSGSSVPAAGSGGRAGQGLTTKPMGRTAAVASCGWGAPPTPTAAPAPVLLDCWGCCAAGPEAPWAAGALLLLPAAVPLLPAPLLPAPLLPEPTLPVACDRVSAQHSTAGRGGLGVQHGRSCHPATATFGCC